MDPLTRLNEYLYNRSDPRTKDWPIVKDTTTISLVSFSYVVFVYVVGPYLMKSRPAFKLNTIISTYNISQIIVNAALFYYTMIAGWTNTFHLGCMPMELASAKEGLQLAHLFWWILIIKMVELVDTVFFILRKKENQVSVLHVYHHATTLILAWIFCKFYPGPMATFPVLLNSVVHVIMYGYYYLTSLGSDVSQKINKFKKYITIVQMVQFTLIIIYSSQVLLPNCDVPTWLALIFIPDVIIVFYLFYNFYKKAYTPESKTKLKVKKK